ncbi:MAG: Coenzyme F420 hydrogenase/dehydrogenase, beta subunit C-terminal domain [Bacilli bacterium]|nr:Coenzyme F420 hydrogenase/dehydrogenase, beta subunit C-terminal domain [Bacilli bacterium]
MSNLKDKNFICTGCFLCQSICPVGAINMEKDSEGFYKYSIDEDKCINCGLCVKKCPKLNPIQKNNEIRECYASYSKDKGILRNSSSGGIFSELANFFLDNNGIVIGAGWSNNDIKHMAITDKKDLPKLRGSKYLQSNLNDIYDEIAEAIKQKRKILFSGTPCQVYAIKSLYGNYSDLYTIDIVCHGVPSKLVLDYSIKQRYNKESLLIDFRNKQTGWYYKFALKYTGEDFSKTMVNDKDGWFVEFLDNKFLKKDCYNCQFTGLKRSSDITLGDFWGIVDIDNDLSVQNQDEGVSLVLINSDKGDTLFNEITNKVIYKKEPLDKAINYNKRIVDGKYSDSALEKREQFYQLFEAKKIYFKDKKNNFTDITKAVKRVVKKIIRK